MNKDFERIKKELTTAKSKHAAAISSIHSKIEKAETDLLENKAKMSAAIEADDRQAYRKYADQCEYDEKRLALLHQKEASALSEVFPPDKRKSLYADITAVLNADREALRQHSNRFISVLSQDAETTRTDSDDALELLNQISEFTGEKTEEMERAIRTANFIGQNSSHAVDKMTQALMQIGLDE